jgi:hypothetical protein
MDGNKDTVFTETIADFHRRHRTYDRDTFLRKTPQPFLVEVSGTERTRGGTAQFGTMVAYRADLGGSSSHDQEIDPSCRIFPLAKRGTVFPDKITVGRSSNNDVVLNDLTISKLQGYFTLERGEFFFTDADSKNGCTLDSKRLMPLRKTLCPDSALIGFGPKLRFRFMTAELFYANMISVMSL